MATAAVPGLTPTAVSSAPDDPADFDSALLLDSEGKRWRVRSPRHAEASARLETEFLVLRAFVPGIRAELPFLMPTVAGTVRQGPLSTFVYSHLAGSTRSVEDLGAGSPAVAREIGAALAAIHDLPHSLVSNADLPSYTPNEFRQRRLNELDQAATTGKIPPLLLRRWEHALEDVSLWRFNPCVVHGDLHEDNLLVDGDRVTAVTGWTDLRIGDPADDMAWLVASNDQDFVDAVLAHYTSSPARRARRPPAAACGALRRIRPGAVPGQGPRRREPGHDRRGRVHAHRARRGRRGTRRAADQRGTAPPACARSRRRRTGPQAGTPPDNAPVPAVSKVTLLAPDAVSGLAAVPTSSAMPAVQVTPIPVDEPAAPADGAVRRRPCRPWRRLPRTPSTPSRIAGVQADSAFRTRPAAGTSGRTARPSDAASRQTAPVQADGAVQAEAASPADRRRPRRTADDTSTTALTVVEAKSR